jgi:hypothetical protein
VLSKPLEFLVCLADRQGYLRRRSLNNVQQWALGWLIIHERNETGVTRYEHEKFLVQLHNPELWNRLYGDTRNDDEIGVDMSLDEVENFLLNLDKQHTISNRELGRIQPQS